MRRKSIPQSTKYTLEELTEGIRELINKSQNENIRELNLREVERKRREKQKLYLRKALRRCFLGDFGSREYVKEYIKWLLENKLGICEANIYSVIPFHNSGLISVQDKFEYIYCCELQETRSVFDVIYRKHKWDKRSITDTDKGFIISDIDIEEAYDREDYGISYPKVLDMISQRIYQTLYGHSVADLLIADDSLDGISGGTGGSTHCSYNYISELSGMPEQHSHCYDTLYVMYRGKNIHLPFLSFGSQKTLERVVRNICRYDAGRALSRNNAMVVSSMMDNSRVVVARPPVSDSWVFYIRRFTSSPVDRLEELLGDKGNDKAIYILKSIVETEQNFIITGNQGGGKTTLLKALVRFIDSRYTLRIAESTFELNINNLYPERNVHAMQERGVFTLYDALTAYKKTDTDIIILGELNEPRAAGALVQIVQNGGKMAISTAHHNSTEKLIDYLRNSLMSEYGINDVRAAEEQAVNTVNFDIHMVRDTEGHHYIERITEIVPTEKGRKLYECRDILVYDSDKKEYFIADTFSSTTFDRIKAVKGNAYAGSIQEYISNSYKRRNFAEED